MKRIIRDRYLTPEEAAKYRKIREQVDQEMPEIIVRIRNQMAALEELEAIFAQLKAAREAQGLSLADVGLVAGIEPSAVFDLENEKHTNPTMETLVRFAGAVGKRISITLSDSAAATESPPALEVHSGS